MSIEAAEEKPLNAIVIEHFSASRMLLRDCVTELGLNFKNLLLSPSPERALQMVTTIAGRFDLVIVNQHDEHSRWDGISLVRDREKRKALVPGYCFILIVDEPSQGEVNSIMQHAPDGLLLKPYTGKAAKGLIETALNKCLPLQPVWQAVADGSHEDGLALLQERLINNPRNLLLHRTYSVILMQAGQFEEAIRMFRRILDTSQRPPDWALLGLVEALYRQGKLTEAKALLDDAEAKTPFRAPLYDWKARIASDQGELEVALDTYRRASEIAPGAIERLATIGLLARALDNHGLATKALRQLVAEVAGTTHELPIYRLQLARSHIDLALNLQSQAQEEVPAQRKAGAGSPEPGKRLPRASTSDRELTQATLVLNQIRKPRSEADRRALLVVKARLLAAKKEIRRAKETIASLNKLDSDWFDQDEAMADSLLDEARAHLAVGNTEQMERLMADIRQLTLTSPVVNKMVQNIADNLNLTQEAESRNKTGMRHYQRGNLEAAFNAFESAFDMAPDEPSFGLNACQAGIEWFTTDSACQLSVVDLEHMLDTLREQDLTPSNAQRFEAFQHRVTVLAQR